MRFRPLFAALCAACVLAGCGTAKLTEDEIVSRIQKTGSTVEKGAKIHHSLQGADQAFWIDIDGDRVAAYRFSTVSEARLKGKSFRDGFTAGYWAFEYANERLKAKIESALK